MLKAVDTVANNNKSDPGSADPLAGYRQPIPQGSESQRARTEIINKWMKNDVLSAGRSMGGELKVTRWNEPARRDCRKAELTAADQGSSLRYSVTDFHKPKPGNESVSIVLRPARTNHGGADRELLVSLDSADGYSAIFISRPIVPSAEFPEGARVRVQAYTPYTTPDGPRVDDQFRIKYQLDPLGAGPREISEEQARQLVGKFDPWGPSRGAQLIDALAAKEPTLKSLLTAMTEGPRGAWQAE